MYGKTVSKEAESRREQCSTELGRQLEIVVGSFANGIAQYCVQLADMLRSDHAQLKQQLTKQLAHYQSACSAAGGVQTTESMLRQLSDLYQQGHLELLSAFSSQYSKLLAPFRARLQYLLV